MGRMDRLVVFVGKGLYSVWPVLTYLPQYHLLRKKGKEGFSSFTCLFLLLSSALRVAYWVGAHVRDGSALVAWVFTGVMQLLLLDAIVCVKRKKGTVPGRFNQSVSGPRYGSTTKALGTEVRAVAKALAAKDYGRAGELFRKLKASFWAWDELAPYVEVVVVFSLGLFALCVMLLRYDFFRNALGFVGAVCEAGATLPQLRKNSTRRDTQGLSVVMVFCWLATDSDKFHRASLHRARACAAVQIACDLAIIAQIARYSAYGHATVSALSGGDDDDPDQLTLFQTLRLKLKRQKRSYAALPTEAPKDPKKKHKDEGSPNAKQQPPQTPPPDPAAHLAPSPKANPGLDLRDAPSQSPAPEPREEPLNLASREV